jgi:autotransporter translocation and assembly factor TamB
MVRRTLRIVALTGTLLVGVVALALIVSQTPWFRDWLRRYAVRTAGNYVNGTLTIGSLGGDLFYGVELGDVAIDVNGEHVVTLKQVEIKYSLSELVSKGVLVRKIVVRQPYVLLRHDAAGWNVASLIKRQRSEADRQGPGKPISLPDIEVVDGRVAIDDRAPARAWRLPSTIDGVNARAGFEYAPVHYSVTLDRLAFNGHAPDVAVSKVTGRFGTREDDLHVEKVFLQTPHSSITVDGVLRAYLTSPSLELTLSAPSMTLAEFAGVVPALQGYPLHPKTDVKATGPLDRLQLAVNAASEAGTVHGIVTGDFKAPDFGVRGNVTVQKLNLALVLKDPARKSDITGTASVDLRLPDAPASAPPLDRLRGRVVFDGSRTTAEGYTASAAHVTADFAGRRIAIDGRADAYGASATAKGFIAVPSTAGAPVVFDLAGRASHVSLAALPPRLDVPAVRSDLNASEYHVKGSIARASTIEGQATLEPSRLAGGAIAGGTTAEFGWNAGSLTYAGRGEVRGVNLERVGRAFKIDALATPEYASRLDATFDLKGSGTSVDTLRIDATGTATDSQIYGGTVPRVAFETHVAAHGVSGRVNGEFRDFDPGRLLNDPQYKGRLSGTVDGGFGIADTSAPVTPDSVTLDGTVTVADGEIAGVHIDSADVEGAYANRRGTLRQATIKGAGVELKASGPIALDTAGQTNVAYHAVIGDLGAVAALLKQPEISGKALLDGLVTGNATELRIAGALDGSNVAYRDNKALDLNSHYTVTVPDLDAARVKVEAQSSGTFIQALGLDIQSMTAGSTFENKTLTFQTHVAEAAAVEAGGGARELDASGSVIFHPDHSEIHLPSLALRTQGIEWKTPPNGQAAIEYGSNRLEVRDLTLGSGDQSVGISGTFALGDAPQLGAVTVNARNVDLAQLEKLAMQDRGFTGRLNGTATLTGNASAPDVTAHLDVENGGFRQFKYESLTADGTFANSRIGLDAKLVQAPGIEVTAKGTLPMSAVTARREGFAHVETAPGEAIDLRIQSTAIDLGIVQGFTPAVRNVTGTVQMDVTVLGTGSDPHLRGYIDFKNGAFALPDANVNFSGLQTRIELEPERIRVPRFQILDQHGKALTIQGELAAHQGQDGGDVNVSLDADDFKLMDNELGNVHLETHLKLTGDLRQPRLEGDVRTDAARLELDRILNLFAVPYSEEALPDIISAQDTVTSAKGADEATRAALAKGRAVETARAPQEQAIEAPKRGLIAATAVNVRFVAPGNLIVRGDDIRPGGPSAASVGSVNTTLGADLRIMKEVDGPITLHGTATTVRGFYEFQGRRFTVVRDGTLQFRGTPDLYPALDVSAERLIPNTGVTAKIHITGTPRAPKIALTSDPPLDEADILSLIVFNRSVNELGTGERSSLAETAGGIASGFVAQSLGRSIGKALDVDLFEITTSDPDTGESAGGVTLGKQVGDKLFVQFRQQFGNRSFTEFMLEYQLAKYLRLDLQGAPQSSGVANRLTQRRVERAGVDLIFFFSY